jgi:DNA-binding transcriptional regulator YbjK
MATAQEPTQARGRQRRELLLRAATELLASGGAKAVTHRAVAARAGLPAASTTYYFESIQQLTEEALRLHVHDRIEELRVLAEAATRDGGSAGEIAQRFAEALTARSADVTIAQFEVYLEAARNPALRAPVAEALAAFESLARSVLAALGAQRPTQAASAFVALIDGFALHQLARPHSVQEEAALLLEAMRALFVVHLMDDDELARWDRRLAEQLAWTPDPGRVTARTE